MAAASPPPFFSPSPPDKKSRHFERSEASEKSFVLMLRNNLNCTPKNNILFVFQKALYLCAVKFYKKILKNRKKWTQKRKVKM